MALPPKYIDINLSGGIDAKTDRKLVRPPQTLRADNVRYVTAGSVRKRYGLNYLPPLVQNGGNTVTSLGATNSELLASDVSGLYAYSPSTDAWSNRGVCPQTSLAVKTIGSYQLPLGNSLTSTTQQVRQLTYDVSGRFGLAAWDTGDTIITDGTNYLSTINLVLFDTTSGKLIWSTTISQPCIPGDLSQGAPLSIGIIGNSPDAGTRVTNTITAIHGVAYPVIKTFRNNFYLAYLATADGLRSDVTPFSNQTFYFVQMLQIIVPTVAPFTIPPPVVTAGSITNAQIILNGPGIYTTASNATTPQLYFDMASTVNDLTVFVNGQSKKNTGSGVQSLVPSASVIGFTATNSIVQRHGLPTNGAELVTLTASDPGPDATYVAAYPDGAMAFTAPARNVINASGFVGPNLYTNVSPPMSVYISKGSPTLGYDVIQTDGARYAKYRLTNTASTPTLTASTYASVKVDYGASPGAAFLRQPKTNAPILQSRIFQAFDGKPVAWIMLQGYNATSFNCLALVEIGAAINASAAIYAHAFYLRAGAALQGRQACNAVNRGILAYQLTDIPNQVAAVKWLTLTSTPAPSIVKLNQGALVTGADTKYYDGATVRTAGWLKFPEIPAITDTVADGKLVSGFAYSYVAVWVDYDAYGNAIYSSPSPVTYLNGATSPADPTVVSGKANVTANSPIITSVTVNGTVVAGQRAQVPGFGFYTTVARVDTASRVIELSSVAVVSSTNATVTFTSIDPRMGAINSSSTAVAILQKDYDATLTPQRGQVIFYRNSSRDPLTYRRIPPLTYLAPTSDRPDAVYADLSPDDNLSNPQLYSQPSTNGGELPNDPPPSSLYAVTTLKRAFVSSAENPSWLYFGKPYFPGRPPEFNAEQFLDIDPPSGDITGLAVLDQNVIIFKKERIFVLSGDGPDATGRGVFNNTYAVATDTGCLDPKSIVSTESGVYFRSIRGIQLLDRSLAVSYIGASVENLIASSTITSSVLVPGQNQIRFALHSFDPLIDGGPSDNVVLVYDYFLKAWSTYSFNPTSDPAFSLQLVGQTTWQNNWFGLAGNGIFQDAGPYTTSGVVQFTDGTRKMKVNGVDVDVPIEVPMTIETPWLPMAGPQGFGRLRRVSVLGDFRSNHVLTLWIFYDYDDNDVYNVPSDPLNLNRKFYKIPFTPDVTLAPGSSQEWRVRAPRQVGQSVKFRLVDSSTGEACVITGLLLETSQKSGAPRLPDAQSV